MGNNLNKKRNLLVYAVGLFIYALGASISTKPHLGITPITSVGYITAYLTGVSLGTTLFVINVVLVLMQFALLRKDFQKRDWLQIPVSVMFSFFIDLTMSFISWIQPTSFFMRWACFFLSMVFMGLGLSLVILSNAIVLPGDGLARVIAQKTGLEFGNAKVINDSIMVLITVVTSFSFLHRIEGIHVGTVIAACVLGNIAKGFMHILKSSIESFVSKPEINLQVAPKEE